MSHSCQNPSLPHTCWPSAQLPLAPSSAQERVVSGVQSPWATAGSGAGDGSGGIDACPSLPASVGSACCSPVVEDAESGTVDAPASGEDSGSDCVEGPSEIWLPGPSGSDIIDDSGSGSGLIMAVLGMEASRSIFCPIRLPLKVLSVPPSAPSVASSGAHVAVSRQLVSRPQAPTNSGIKKHARFIVQTVSVGEAWRNPKRTLSDESA